MKVLFAMDLFDGKVVRLQKGDFSKVTEYSHDPPSKIEEMMKEGAKDFHIIDLDGARTGSPRHRELIKKIRKKVNGYIEIGGGIRTGEDIEDYTASGVNGVIVGTAPLEDDAFFHGLAKYRNIILGLDLYEGKPMVRGWKTAINHDIKEIIELAEAVNVMAILCTSIAKDGMLSGPDYTGMKKMLGRTRIPLIASGGVAHIDDVKKAKDMGVWAIILGKAIYEGLIRIEEAAKHAD